MNGTGLSDLDKGAKVGTSSLRRCAQVLHHRADFEVVEFRGNVNTRLEKLAAGVADATFLAVAGIKRLGLHGVPYTPIPVEDMLPAVAQGAIGIERRGGDSRAAELLEALHHKETGFRVSAERAFLEELDGSCQTPIAGYAELDGGDVRLRGQILRTDGSEAFSADLTGAIEDGVDMGRTMARRLLAKAGDGFFDWN